MMTKIRAVFVVPLIGIAIFGAIFLFMNSYYKRRNFEFVKAIWNTKEAYVFVQTTTTVERVPTWKILFAIIAGRSVANEHYSLNELVVFHSNEYSDKIEKQSNIDIAGQLLISSNTPHIIQGGYEIKGFRLMDEKFGVLSGNETHKIQEHIKSDKAFWLKEGWKKLDWEELGNLGNSYDRTFQLAEMPKHVELHIQTFPPLASYNPRVIIEVLVKGKKQTLIDLSQNRERIRKEEFINIKAFQNERLDLPANAIALPQK